jgi:hypothetical protein
MSDIRDQLLNQIENIKKKISDNEYKTLLETLGQIKSSLYRLTIVKTDLVKHSVYSEDEDQGEEHVEEIRAYANQSHLRYALIQLNNDEYIEKKLNKICCIDLRHFISSINENNVNKCQDISTSIKSDACSRHYSTLDFIDGNVDVSIPMFNEVVIYIEKV